MDANMAARCTHGKGEQSRTWPTSEDGRDKTKPPQLDARAAAAAASITETERISNLGRQYCQGRCQKDSRGSKGRRPAIQCGGNVILHVEVPAPTAHIYATPTNKGRAPGGGEWILGEGPGALQVDVHPEHAAVECGRVGGLYLVDYFEPFGMDSCGHYDLLFAGGVLHQHRLCTR
jgi:hypothetical protein